jgi:CheY-like chemotaxis protein
MSHELRTPLNGILGYAQILRNDPTLTEAQREGLEAVRQCAEHLLGLINEILDMAKIEAGRMELEPHDFSLPRLLHELAAMFRHRAEDKGLSFALVADAALPEVVCADARKLRQVLINLLDNAVKFTHAGSVELRASRGDAGVRFEVTDTGPGISPEQANELFEPFTQLHDPSTRHEGTGLGLAISQRLVKLMGSELRVRSNDGQGSRFSFDLSLPEALLPARTSPERDRVIAGYRGAARRVLIADDNTINRKVLCGLLEPLGFQCAQAIDGEDCLHQVDQMHPDVVLMDVVMPKLDGLAAVRRLRAQPGTARLPVIALSASVLDADREQCLQAGCDDFVAQPVQAGELLDTLARCLHIEWEYRQPLPAPRPTPAPAACEPLPEAQARALREAARKGHLTGITEQVHALEALGEPFAASAKHIRELARQFRFDEIADLAER